MKDDFILSLYQKPQSVFSLKEISLLFPYIPYDSIKSRTSYYVKRGKLLRPRKGIYAKENFSPFELATKLYTPSYISLETVLEKEGIVFQKYNSVFVISYVTRTIQVGGSEIIYRGVKRAVLLNTSGIVEKDNYFIAVKERAFLDSVFLYKDYHFDNLKPLNWEKVMELKYIYGNKILEKRLEDYYQLYKKEYV